MLAPPWIPIPPPTYGGIELVVHLLTEELARQGHDVTLFCSPGSKTRANAKISTLSQAYPNRINNAMLETDHVLQALSWTKNLHYDVIHDHTSMAVALAKHCDTPLVHTMHNGHEGDRGAYYMRHAYGHATLVAVSQAQRDTAPEDMNPFVVPNPVDTLNWPFRPHKEDYALWVGRMDPVKGAHRAIRAARIAGMKLILAGPVQPGHEHYFEQRVRPWIDDDRVRYVGSIGGARKKQLFARAKVFLMPIKWNEPFGMVMVEALACGTPVLAFPYGAATEIVIDEINGHQVADVPAMAEAMQDLSSISAEACRESVVSRYSPTKIARQYVEVYEAARVQQIVGE